MPKALSAFIACVGLTSIAAFSTNHATTYCRSPGIQSTVARIGIIAFLTSANSTVAQFRSDLGFHGLDSTRVLLVTDEAKCERGSAVIDSVRGYAVSGSPVYVWTIGPARYAVDPGVHSGREERAVYLFDTLWIHKGSIAVPNAAQ
jgi:hypothetical protein